MEFHKDESNMDWTKENGGREKPFDFDAFLEDENYSLDDQVTRVLGGRELLEPDAFGEGADDYVPSRRGEGDRGRHELRSPETTAVNGTWQEEPETLSETEEPPADRAPRFDPNDPRYAAPERPQIIVAEPRSKVVIEPDVAENSRGGEKTRERGVSEGLKWVIAALVVIAILGGVSIKLFGGSVNIKNMIASILPRSETSEKQPNDQGSAAFTVTVTPTPKPTQTPNTPTPAPEVTPEPVIATHNISASAGEGGSISPSGVINVRDGESVTFSIFPADGYSLNRLVVDGAPAEMGGTYTFHDVTGDHTIYAEFLKDSPLPMPETLPPEPTPEPTAEPTPEPVTPEPITPEPVTPEPITPEPLPPEEPGDAPEPAEENGTPEE